MALRPGDIDLSDPDVFVRHGGPPHDYLALLRREAPVSWNPAPTVQKTVSPVAKGFWVLTKHADLVHVSRSPKLFSSQVGAPFLWDMEEENLAGVRVMLIGMDPPQHVKYRRLVQPGFTPSMVKKIEPVIRQHARRIVDEVARKGECEFVEALACELPLTLICELMGVPFEDRKQIFEWSNQMVGADDGEMSAADHGTGASVGMWMYSNQLAAKKREKPDDTLISKYLHSAVDGETISEFELNNFFVLLAVAGSETTRNATSHFIRLMHDHPDQYDLLRSNVDRYLPGAIEEVLRYSPPVMNFRRTALEDTEIRGVRIAKGDKLYLSYPSANRDEEVFPDAQRFDITREENPHLAFGIGEHFCLGANLARMQLDAILREVLTRLPDLAVVGPPAVQRSNFIHGIKRMPVRFTPET
jgi:cytochrome P450